MIAVNYRRGVELPEHGLWLDPWEEKEFAFVSHAHSDHIGNHRQVIMSAGTARLMQARLPGEREETILQFGARQEFPGFSATLLPAGHIFGSAQILVESEAGSLLYTGDFKLRSGLSAETTEWRPADTLIMETTYGLPKYRMPPTEQVIKEMVEFCHVAIEEGAVPVLLGYSLGKSQEILCALLKNGLIPMLHGSVLRMTEIYRQLQPDFPTGYVRYTAGEVEGKVLVCPPSAARSLMLQRIRNRRTAVLTGWALDSGARFRYGCDAAFPLTDHADYTDLVRYVELVAPKRVLTLHGFASAFAADLRQRGFEAWALSQQNQLELTLDDAPAVVAGHSFPETAQVEDSAEPTAADDFRVFSALGQQISATMSKLAKIELLSAYFRQLSALDADLLAPAAIYLTGRAFAQSDARTLQTGWAIIMRALVQATGKPEAQVREIARQHSDAGKTAYEVLMGGTKPALYSLHDSATFFATLQRARGPLQKTELLRETLVRLTPLEGSYVVRIITGDLRIGLREGLVEEAIAAAFDVPAAAVREANMLLGDIGETAVRAARGTLTEAAIRLFHPVKCMLASPETTAEAVYGRLLEFSESVPSALAEGPTATRDHSFWVEDKYDGIRAQLHFGGGRVEIFTRDLRPATGQFADVAAAARLLDREMILDGEIIAFAEGRKLTFFDLQKRLGRKTEDDLFLDRTDIPVIYRAFDLLLLDGRSLLREPLSARRRLLEGLALPSRLEVAPIVAVHSAEEIEQAFQAARDRGNEGLIAKEAASLYTPGRRGLAWLKFKKELATLDVVVVGAETGHGKRSGVLSDYTFAVRDEVSGELRIIGKAYSGVTDDEIEELTEHFRATTLRVHGKFREVRPEIVFEVAFDSIQPSARHNSGLALRFPRIKAIRREKTIAEIDTLAYARSLVG